MLARLSTTRILLGLLVVLAFGVSLTHGFHFDDVQVIQGAKWTDFETRPLTWLSFEANAWLGTRPFAWHLVNLVAHLAAVFLLYELLLVWAAPAAFLGAALFAIHPIQAEAVAYVYARATLFSTVFSLAAMLAWARGRKLQAPVYFLLALLAKEDCVMIPAAIALIDSSRGKLKRRDWVVIAGMLLMAATAGVLTLLATRAPGSGAGFTAGIPWPSYLLQEGAVILRYLRLVVFPYGFTIDPEIHFDKLRAIAAWAGVGLLSLLATRVRGGLWFVAGLLLLLPSSSVFPATDLAADHRMYLPMVAFAAAIAVQLIRTPRWVQAAVPFAFLLVSISRMGVWADDAKLWAEAVQQAPRKVRPRIQLARALQPAHALESLEAARAEFPNDVDVENELGRVYLELGQPEKALVEYGRVLAAQPRDARAVNNRAVALRAMGQSAAAQTEFQRALTLDACLAEARRNLNISPCVR